MTMALSRDQLFLFDFVASRAEQEPVAIRVRLYRGLAHSSSDKTVSEKYRRRANNFEAQNRAAQLELATLNVQPATTKNP